MPFQQQNLAFVYPKCKIHRNQICEFLCKNCWISVCSFCMVSNKHKGHEFFELSEVYKTKKKMIKNEKDKLEKKFSYIGKRYNWLRKPNCQHGCKIWKTDKRNVRTKK